MSGRLRLATFNIKNGAGPDGIVDNDRLAMACAELRADVLALQEVDSGAPRSGHADQAAVVGRACGLASVHAPAFELRTGGQYGNALLARGHIDDVEVLHLPVARGRQPRVVILATVEVGDVTLSVGATHFQNRRGGAPLVADDADEQLEQLAVVLEALRHRPRPRALLGDLNSAPVVVDPVLTAAGFSVADTPPTAPARAPRLRIDYIAVDGLTIVSSDAVLTGVSDHLAVVVDATR